MLTPAINSPNAIPKSPRDMKDNRVGAGSQILPGAFGFVIPSKSRTSIINSVEIIPKMDAKDSRDRGINADGIKLNNHVSAAFYFIPDKIKYLTLVDPLSCRYQLSTWAR